MAEPEDEVLEHELIRINSRAWGVSFGLLLGLGMFVATNLLVLKGGPDVGTHLGRLGHVFPGYDVSFTGSLVGFVYCFVLGYGLGRVLSPRRAVPAAEARELLANRHPPLHGHMWGLAIGVISAVALFGTTVILLAEGGQDAGALISNLAIYLPGYAVSLGGAAIGAAWLLVLGYVTGRLVAGIYNRLVAALA